VLGWDFNEHDAYPVRISDPHFQQTPRFQFRCPHNLNTGRLKALVFGRDVPDLYPEGEIATGSPIRGSGDLQVTSTEKENKPRITAVTELARDGKAESVPVETSAAISIGWSQQDPATEDVHVPDHAARPGTLIWRPQGRSRTMAASQYAACVPQLTLLRAHEGGSAALRPAKIGGSYADNFGGSLSPPGERWPAIT
jgi:hypothetical protein